MRSGVFLTNFEVFHLVMKHCEKLFFLSIFFRLIASTFIVFEFIAFESLCAKCRVRLTWLIKRLLCPGCYAG